MDGECQEISFFRVEGQQDTLFFTPFRRIFLQIII